MCPNVFVFELSSLVESLDLKKTNYILNRVRSNKIPSNRQRHEARDALVSLTKI